MKPLKIKLRAEVELTLSSVMAYEPTSIDSFRNGKELVKRVFKFTLRRIIWYEKQTSFTDYLCDVP